MTYHEEMDAFHEWAEGIMESYLPDDAYEMIVAEIKTRSNRRLPAVIGPLNHFRREQTLDLMEVLAPRIENVSENWGHLAAASRFTWARAAAWLRRGRPLSLIALDALYH